MHITTYKQLIIFALGGLLMPFFTFATDYSSTNFKVKDPVINDAGGRSTSGSFIEIESLGQNAIGISNSSNFILKSGFLYFSDPSTDTPGSSDTSPGSGPGQGNVPIHLLPFFQRPLPEIPKEELEEIIEELPCGADYIPQDLNCDHKVDLVDFSIFLYLSDERNSPPENNPADFNHDGKVTIIDLSILFAAWTEHLAVLPETRGATLAEVPRDTSGSFLTRAKTATEKTVAFAKETVKTITTFTASSDENTNTRPSPEKERGFFSEQLAVLPIPSWKTAALFVGFLIITRLALGMFGI